jgi:hypothetical protein
VISGFDAFSKSRGNVRDENELFDIVMRRESMATGTGDGTMIPQGRLKDLAGVLVASGRSRESVAVRSTGRRQMQKLILELDDKDQSCR